VGRARVFGDLNDPESGVSKLLAKHPVNTLMPEVGTDPKIYYINLDGELVTGSTAFDTIYPYASGANTDEYDDLTGQVLLQTPLGGEPAEASGG
jgi:tetrathionate reductase subunit B